jgi:predicted  nucleic acid-binding Zn-ribbon protein
MLSTQITTLNDSTTPWTQSQLSALSTVLTQASQDQETLVSLLQPLESHLQALRERSDAALREGREHLDGGVKEVETLGARLEYEINELRSKVEDVEVGVADFEKGVVRVEERVAELEAEGESDARWRCVVC